MQTSVAGSSLWLAEWSDATERGDTRTAYYLGIYGVLGLIQAVFVTYGWYAMTRGNIKAAKSLHQKMLEQILHSPMSFFDTTPLGRILNRFSKDVDTCDATLQQTIRVVLTCGFTTISTLVIISVDGVNEQFIKESDDRLDLNNACFYPNVAANRWLSIRLEM
ncbi:unnamed protein product, partial [Oppiella nova]